MRVRKVRCPECGAPKVTPSKCAYVYCDFCGRFMDWDGEIAKQSGGVATGPRYRELTEALAPRLAASRAVKDKTALAACHRQLFDQFMTDCPTTDSPRIGDPAYREAMLVRSVHAQVAR
jgi:ribosomal protein S27E